jgi:hypothetical protein
MQIGSGQRTECPRADDRCEKLEFVGFGYGGEWFAQSIPIVEQQYGRGEFDPRPLLLNSFPSSNRNLEAGSENQ